MRDFKLGGIIIHSYGSDHTKMSDMNETCFLSTQTSTPLLWQWLEEPVPSNWLDIRNVLLKPNEVPLKRSNIQKLIITLHRPLDSVECQIIDRIVLQRCHPLRHIEYRWADTSHSESAMADETCMLASLAISGNYENTYRYLLHSYRQHRHSSSHLHNLLAFLLVSRQNSYSSHLHLFHFLDSNSLCQHLNWQHQTQLWFELGQIFTKKYQANEWAEQCYQHIERILHKHDISSSIQLEKTNAVRNARALIRTMEHHEEEALQLEKQTLQHDRKSSSTSVLFTIQTLLNISRIYTSTKRPDLAYRYALRAKKEAVGEWAVFSVPVYTQMLHIFVSHNQWTRATSLMNILLHQIPLLDDALLRKAIQIAKLLMQQQRRTEAASIYSGIILKLPIERLSQAHTIMQFIEQAQLITDSTQQAMLQQHIAQNEQYVQKVHQANRMREVKIM